MVAKVGGDFEADGFAVLPNVFAKEEVDFIIAALSAVKGDAAVRTRGGVYAIRNLMQVSPVITELACSEKVRSLAGEALQNAAFAVRATLFDKTAGANWLVPWHQDLTVCAESKLDVPGYGPWTKKAGVWNVQPPVSVLEQMVSVRIHLDDCDESNGVLRVLPGTHRLGRITASRIPEQQNSVSSVSCVVGAGGVVLVRPLLIHASSAASEAAHRRVVHIDYACCQLDGGLRWAIGNKG